MRKPRKEICAKYYLKNKEIVKARIKKYRETARGKEVVKLADLKYNKTEKARLRHRRFSKTEKAKLWRKRYEKTELGYIRIRNKWFVHGKIRSGKLIKQNKCSDCGCCDTEFHHTKYYYPPKLIDIVEVCHECHLKRHKIGEGIIVSSL